MERVRIETANKGLVFQDPKTSAGVRTLALPASLADELRDHLDRWVDDDPDALVFTDYRTGDTPTKMVWRRRRENARREAEVTCTFHDLRYLAGTHCGRQDRAIMAGAESSRAFISVTHSK